MSRVDVLVQYLFCWKKFAVYVIIVNNFDTDFQCTWLRKRFFTKFTQIIFLNFMNWINVKSQISWGSEGFPTRITNFVFFFVYHGLSWCVSSDNSNQWMYFHRNNIYDRFFFHELLWYDFSNSLIAQSISHNDHICNFFLPSWTTLIWFCKCSDRVKYLPQESHLWSLWPPWWIIFLWFFRFSDRVNNFPQ